MPNAEDTETNQRIKAKAERDEQRDPEPRRKKINPLEE